MFSRMEFALAVIALGFVGGAIAGFWTPRTTSTRLASRYLIVVCFLLAARAAVFAVGAITSFADGVNVASGVVGGASSVWFGALFGLALTADPSRALLREPDVDVALRLSTGVAFALAALGKAFSFDDMTAFFVASGYSPAFLRFIMTTELLGGIALVIPWTTLPALVGLTVDMFGAVWTHVHNGDSIHDSTGAIGMLLRLAAIAALWSLRCPNAEAVRRRLARTGVAAAVCAVVAVAGSARLRGTPPPPSEPDELEYFVGSWHCAGALARSGAPIAADLHFDRVLDGRWLLFRHDDLPPNRYHALAEWHRDEVQWTASIQDSTGSLRIFHSHGWQNEALTWDGGNIDAAPTERITFSRLDRRQFSLRYERLKTDGWHAVDTTDCVRR